MKNTCACKVPRTLARRLACKIVEGRDKAGLTRKLLADRVGMAQHSLAEIEMGNSFPRLDTLIRLARGLGVPLVELVEGVDIEEGEA